jgi:AraC family transcriptional regulator
MSGQADAHMVAQDTFRCREGVPSMACESSRELGWSSLLLDLHAGITSREDYTSISSRDPKISVTYSGRLACEYHTRSRWRLDAYTPGSIILNHTRDETRYRFRRTYQDDHRIALIYLPIGMVQSTHEHLRRLNGPSDLPAFSSLVGWDPAIMEVTRSLVNAMRLGIDPLYANVAAAWLSVHMLSRYASTSLFDDRRQPGRIADQRLARVLDYIAAHYASPITLDDLAGEACVSRFHFARLFKQQMGCTPLRYLANVRLDAAANMLLVREEPVAQIAHECGYATASHFAAAFIGRYGMSPSQFRMERRVRWFGSS